MQKEAKRATSRDRNASAETLAYGGLGIRRPWHMEALAVAGRQQVFRSRGVLLARCSRLAAFGCVLRLATHVWVIGGGPRAYRPVA